MSQDNTQRPRIQLVEVTDPTEKVHILEFLSQIPFNSTIGHTDARTRMTKEQAQALKEQLLKARVGHRPIEAVKGGSILDLLGDIAINAMRTPRGQSKTHPLDDQLQRMFGGHGDLCQGCAGCDPTSDSKGIPETLEIAGMLSEGASLLNLGASSSLFEGATDEDKQTLKDRVKHARKQLKQVLKNLED